LDDEAFRVKAKPLKSAVLTAHAFGLINWSVKPDITPGFIIWINAIFESARAMLKDK
jgi:hypothetical protein